MKDEVNIKALRKGQKAKEKLRQKIYDMLMRTTHSIFREVPFITDRIMQIIEEDKKENKKL